MSADDKKDIEKLLKDEEEECGLKICHKDV